MEEGAHSGRSRGAVSLRALGDLLGIALLAVALSFVPMAALDVSGAPLGETGAAWVFSGALAMALLWWEWRLPLPVPAKPMRTPQPALRALLVGLMAGLLLPLLDTAIEWSLAGLGVDAIQAANEAPIRRALAAAPFATLVQIVLLAPWLEERLLRGRLFLRFRNAGMPWLGMVLTSGVFALMHEFTPDQGQRLAEWLALIGIYAGFGMVMCLLYAWSGRLRTAIAAHAASNLVACGLLWAEISA